jgi:hypothetical protein
MKKQYIVVMLSLMILTVFALQAFAQDYDKDMVREVMKANGKAMGAINEALDADDFFMAATKLMEVAQSMKSLDAVTPPKGSKEEWDGIHGDLVKAAFKGIGACGEEDADKVKQYLGEIGALIKEGHKAFR